VNTIDDLINEIYESNYSHLEFEENMGGEACDCHIHTGTIKDNPYVYNSVWKARDLLEGLWSEGYFD